MTVETMAGTAAYLREHGYDTGAVQARVATPGGTTERGLTALEEHGLRAAFAGRPWTRSWRRRADGRSCWRVTAPGRRPTTSTRWRSSTSS